MKLLASLMVLMFTINGHAAVGLSKELQELVNDYQYSITVEWDQNDKEYLDQKSNEFSIALDDLFKAGLTSEDIKKAYPQVAESIPQNLTRESFNNWVKESSGKFYSQGANWNGTAVLFYGGLAVFFIGFISYSIWYSKNYECASWIPTGPKNTCSEWVRK